MKNTVIYVQKCKITAYLTLVLQYRLPSIIHSGLLTRKWEYKLTLISNPIHSMMMKDIRVCRSCGIVFDMKLRRDKDCPVCHGGENLPFEDSI